MAPRPWLAISIHNRCAAVSLPESTCVANDGKNVEIGIARNVVTNARIVRMNTTRVSRT